MPTHTTTERKRPARAKAGQLGDPQVVETVSVALIDADQKIWLSRRSPTSTWSGYWQFPGGKLEPDEWPVNGATRECAEETGLFLLSHELVYMNCLCFWSKAENHSINKQHMFLFRWNDHPRVPRLFDMEEDKTDKGWTGFTIDEIVIGCRKGEMALMPAVTTMLLELFPGCKLECPEMPELAFY